MNFLTLTHPDRSPAVLNADLIRDLTETDAGTVITMDSKARPEDTVMESKLEIVQKIAALKSPEEPKGKKAKKPKPVNAMNPEETLKLLNYRIQFAANLYGNEWSRELKFLKGCKKAFDKIAKLEEERRWKLLGEKMPGDGEVVNVTIFDTLADEDDDFGREVRCACYEDKQFKIDGVDDNERSRYTVMAWTAAPEPWRAEK